MSTRPEVRYFVDRAAARRGALALVAMASICGILALAGPWITTPDGATRTLWLPTLVAGALVFGLLGLRHVAAARSRRPYLVIDADGIVDGASRYFSGVGRISWDEISRARVGTYQGLPATLLELRDRSRFARRLGALDRIDRSARLGRPAVAFRGPLLSVTPAELARVCEDFRREHERRSGTAPRSAPS